MKSGRVTATAVAFCIVAAVAGAVFARPQAAHAAADGQSLRGAGATFPAPLYQRWIDVYQKEHPQISLSYDAVGSGEGVSRFVTGAVDFGATDAALSDADAAKVTNGVVVVPATAGMVVLAYNLSGLQAGLKLPRDVYADIFAGRITRWDDPRLQNANPGVTVPHRTIAVVSRLDASGTTYAFSRHLDAISETWRDMGLGYGTLVDWPGGAMLVRGNEGVASRIEISEGSIGYVEFGFAQRLGLPVAALQNKAGMFVVPSEGSGQTALSEATADSGGNLHLAIVDPAGELSYPIVTYSWLLLYGRYADPAKAAAIRDFVDWGLGHGQRYASELGYIPLPAAVSARGGEAVAGIR